MAVLIIFPVILQTVINFIMLPIAGQGQNRTVGVSLVDGRIRMVCEHLVLSSKQRQSLLNILLHLFTPAQHNGYSTS